jgi:hypothetical protein
MSNSTKLSHNLNIHMYSFAEILTLFDVTHDMTIDDLKRAKKQVLMLHPDKSKLSSEYFLFYKSAFEIVHNYYMNQNKQNQEFTPENINYKHIYKNSVNTPQETQIKNSLKEIKVEEFQRMFNDSFEKNMSKQIVDRNEWFKQDDPIYNIDKNVNKSNMGAELDKIKEKNRDIVQYKGVQNLMMGGGGSNLYDDIDDNTNSDYITSDPFSKLKFDDLRKVHKDQTVFAVSEKDFNSVPQYKNVDEYNKARSKTDLSPIEKNKAQQILDQQDRIIRESISQKQHQSAMLTKQYSEKNKNVLAQFLRVENGNK